MDVRRGFVSMGYLGLTYSVSKFLTARAANSYKLVKVDHAADGRNPAQI